MDPVRVQFEEEESSIRSTVSRKAGTSIASWLVKNSGGVVKDEKQAAVLLLLFAALLLACAAYFLIDSMRGPESLDARDVREIIQNQQGALPPSR